MLDLVELYHPPSNLINTIRFKNEVCTLNNISEATFNNKRNDFIKSLPATLPFTKEFIDSLPFKLSIPNVNNSIST